MRVAGNRMAFLQAVKAFTIMGGISAKFSRRRMSFPIVEEPSSKLAMTGHSLVSEVLWNI